MPGPSVNHGWPPSRRPEHAVVIPVTTRKSTGLQQLRLSYIPRHGLNVLSVPVLSAHSCLTDTLCMFRVCCVWRHLAAGPAGYGGHKQRRTLPSSTPMWLVRLVKMTHCPFIANQAGVLPSALCHTCDSLLCKADAALAVRTS